VHRTPPVVLSAVTIVAALGLAGCVDSAPPSAAPGQRSPQTAIQGGPTAAPLPSPDTLADVLSRLADTSIPAEQKVGLVQYATVDDQPVLGNFGEALAASGFVPVIVTAADLVWSPQPGNVLATVTIATADPAVKPFTFPMEFTPVHGSWQLTQRTAEQILPMVGSAGPPRTN
jgi:hypothetical protein